MALEGKSPAQPDFYIIKRPVNFEVNGEEKTVWHEVGVMYPKHDGCFFMKLHILGDAVFQVFPKIDDKNTKE